MTDSKITDLTALTGANLATGDVFEVSDISDTTMDASGTSKKMTAAELAIGLATVAPPSRTISSTTTDTSAVNTTTQTTVASHAIPTTAAAGDVFRLIAVGDMLNSSGSGVTYSWKVILGATTAVSSQGVSAASTANRHHWRVEIDVLVVNATNDQRLPVTIVLGDGALTSAWHVGSATVQYNPGRGTATEDLTAGKTLKLDVTMGTANANADFVCHESWLEVVKR